MSFNYLLGSLNRDTLSANTITGRLVDLLPDTGGTRSSDGEFRNALMVLEVPQGRETIPVNILVPIRTLESTLYSKTGAVGQEAFEALRRGASLSASARRSLRQATNVQLTAVLDTPTASLARGGYYKASTLTAPVVNGPELDSIINPEQVPGQGQSTPWPTVNGQPPFTPVPLPWSQPGYSESFRLGYARINVPVYHHSFTRTSRLDTRPTLREPTTMKRNTGMAYESYTLSYTVHGATDIKSGVHDVVNQISICPILTVEGGPFGNPRDQDGEIPYSAIIVRSFTVTTVEGLPNTLDVTINFDPFLWDFYIPYSTGDYPNLVMDDVLCWPLMKIWAETRRSSLFDGSKFTGRLELSFPAPEVTDMIQSLSSVRSEDSEVSEDVEALLTLSNGILSGSLDTQRITSRNVKEIKFPTSDLTTPRIVVMRVQDQVIWESIVGNSTSLALTMFGASEFKPYIVGLVDWETKLANFNYTDSDGNFIPSSVQVPISYVNREFDASQPFTPAAADVAAMDFLSIKASTRESWWVQITREYVAKIAALDSVSATYTEQVDKLTRDRDARIARPWEYYGIALKMNKADEPRLQALFRSVADKHALRARPTPKSAEQILAEKFIRDDASPYVVVDAFNTSSDILVEQISASKQHNLAVTSYGGNPLPLHQYIGGSDVGIVVEGKCFSLAAVNLLKEVKNEFDKRAQMKISRKFVVEGRESHKNRELGAGFLRIENEIFQLMGVEFVLPLTLSIEPVDKQPGVWSFSFTFVEYNPSQVQQETLKFLRTTLDQLGQVYRYGWNDEEQDENPLLQKAQDWFSLQDHLSQEEVYPDLRLPTVTEFKSWVSTCQSLAENYLKTKSKKTFLVAGQLEAGDQLNDFEREILSYVREFLPFHAQRMSKWTNFRTTAQQTPLRSKYVDPDFYVYYNPYSSWANTLDTLSETMMGPPKSLKAQGRDSKAEGTYSPETGPVLTDPLFNTKHVLGEKFWANKSSEIPSVYEASYTNSFTSDPSRPDQAEYAKAQVESFVRQFDQQLEGKRWWNTSVDMVSLELANNPGLYALSPDQARSLFKGTLDSANLNLIQALDQFGQTPGEDQQANDPESILSKFNELGWRQEWALRAAQMGTQNGRSIEMKTDTHGQWFFPKAPFSAEMSGANLNSVQRLAALSDLIQSAIRSSLAGNGDHDGIATSSTAKSMLDFASLLNLSTLLNKTYGYLSNTARINSNYQAVDRSLYNSTPLSLNVSNNAQKNTLESFNHVDSVAKAYSDSNVYVDPHVLRAFFLSRDGLGAFNPLLSLDDGGFGDLSAQAVPLTATTNQRLEYVAARYAHYMREYGNVPTLALAAVDIEVNTKSRQLYMEDGKLRAPVENNFKNAANFIQSKRFSEDTGVVIARLLEQYPDVGQRVNKYWTQYVQLNRSLGSYVPVDGLALKQVSDPFFYSLNGIVQMDAASDNVNQYLRGTFSPTGAEVTINLVRNQITYLDPIVERSGLNFDLNQSSLDLELALGTKLNSALDPHTEGAVYGSMVDIRTHGSFGRLAGAFPSYQVLIINEGFYWGSGNSKLWDQYYSRTGVAEIEIFKSRLQPGAQCNITFSNMFNNLTAYTQLEVLQHELSVQTNKRMAPILKNWGLDTFKAFWETLTRQVPKEVLQVWHSNNLRQLALSPGARLHVRMGFGSNAASLPVVFNGTVAEMPVQEGYVTLMAVGDGYELEKPTTTSLIQVGDGYSFSDGGPLGTGKDPSSILSEAMVGAGLADNILQGAFRDRTQGLAHFGDVYFQGVVHHPTEMQINIYSSNQTKLEQQIPMIANYLNVNALYNWQGVNLFSVQVHEPTLWKILTVCRRACLDYVGSAEEFCTRGTVFFGKSWWPYNYTYADSFLDFARFLGRGRQQEQFHTSLPESPQRGDKANSVIEVINQAERQLATFPNLLEASRKLTNLDPVQVTVRDQSRTVVILYNNGGYARFELVAGNWIANIHDLKGSPDYDVSDPTDPRSGGRRSAMDERTELSQTLGGVLLNKPPQSSRNNVHDFLSDIKTYVQHLKWKNHMQAYIAHSMINMLQNDIVVDSSKVYTDAVGVHKYNGVASADSLMKTIAYSVDSDIQPGERRTMTVDTGLIVTTAQGGLGRAIGENVTRIGSYIPIPVLNAVSRAANEYIMQTPTTPAVENAVISALVDSVKEMYQGQLVLTGQPSMKPQDLLLVTDHKNDMRGPVFVKEVVHLFNAENGLLTIVTPDCVVMPHSSLVGYQLITSLTQGALNRAAQFYMLKSMSSLTLNNFTRYQKKNAARVADVALARYLDVRDKLVFSGEEKTLVRDAYKTRVTDELSSRQKKELEELEKRFDRLRKTSENGVLYIPEDNLDEYKKAQRLINIRYANELREVNQLDTLEQAKAYSSKSGSLPLTADDYEVVEAGPRKQLRIRMTELEIDMLAEEELDRRALETMELRGTTPDEVIEAKRNARRASFAESEPELIKAQAEARAGTLASAQDVVRLEKQIDALTSNIDTLGRSIDELNQLEELTDKQKLQLKELTEAWAEQKTKLRTVNKELTLSLDAFKADSKETKRLLELALRGGNFFDDVLGSTLGVGGKILEGAKNAPGRAVSILREARDARRVSGQPRGVTKLRYHAMLIRDKVKQFSSDVKGVKNLGDAKTLVQSRRLRTAANAGLDQAKLMLRAGTLASYAGPQLILRLAFDVTMASVGASIIEGVNARWKARQCVKIIPLMVGNPPTPLVAGIRGHQGAVIGDDPSWSDKLIENWTHLDTTAASKDDSASGRLTFLGTNLLMFSGAMLGLEPPEYGSDGMDADFIRSSRMQEAGGGE